MKKLSKKELKFKSKHEINMTQLKGKRKKLSYNEIWYSKFLRLLKETEL